MTDPDPITAPATPLVVPLDNGVIRTRLSNEQAMALMSRQPQRSPGVLMAGIGGRLSGYVAGKVEIDPVCLPYDEEVLETVRAAKADGREVVLVSDADPAAVQAIADHLDLFDRVGTAAPDGAETLTPPARDTGWKPYVKAIRPHQWLKNILIFLPLLAAHAFFAKAIMACVLAFIAFSLAASSVYVLNDLMDLSADRAHPRKRKRPFASGAIPLRHGFWMAPGMLILAFGLAALTLPGYFSFVLASYYAATMAYSFVLKRKRVIDICMLAGLYTMRVIAGGAAADLLVSPWMLAFSVFLFLSLAAVKRQAELVDGKQSNTEKIAGRGYAPGDLPIVEMMGMAAGYNAVLVMALYISSAETSGLYNSPLILWCVCPVLLYWISRMVMIAHNGHMDDDPVIFAVRDRTSQFCGMLVLGFAVAAAFL